MTLEGLENKSCEVNRSTAIWKKNNHISLLLNHYLPLEKSIMLKKISYYFRGGKKGALISAFIPANTTLMANALLLYFWRSQGSWKGVAKLECGEGPEFPWQTAHLS